MIYVYRRAASDGAVALADALNDANAPARRTQGRLLRERFRVGRDKLVCWGDHWPAITGGLNNVAPMSKYDEAVALTRAGVRTVEVALTRPATIGATRGIFAFPHPVQQVDDVNARRIIGELQEWLDRPLPAPVEWLPRRNNHVGGSDLLRPGQADYYSRREQVVEEYRIHIFKGKSIRAGVKVGREGMTPHQWIRSFDAGWRIQYDGFKSSKPMRELAAGAVAALGLDFGAVDLGKLADGSLMVLEVNRAPGIEGGTVDRYVTAITQWAQEA